MHFSTHNPIPPVTLPTDAVFCNDSPKVPACWSRLLDFVYLMYWVTSARIYLISSHPPGTCTWCNVLRTISLSPLLTLSPGILPSMKLLTLAFTRPVYPFSWSYPIFSYALAFFSPPIYLLNCLLTPTVTFRPAARHYIYTAYFWRISRENCCPIST